MTTRTLIRLDGRLLLREMQRRGLDQRAFAEQAGIHQQTIRKALRGEPVSPLKYRQIMRGLRTASPLDDSGDALPDLIATDATP